MRLPPDGRESSRQTPPCRRRSSSSTVRQRQTPSSCGAVITNPNPHAAPNTKTLRLGVPAPYTSSVSARCLVSAQATPSLRSGVAWADTTVSSSFLLLHGTATADTVVVRCSDHQSESTCSTKHKTRSGDKPPRSSPSLACARSVGSSGSDGGLTGATKHRTPPVGRGRRLVAPLPPSPPSSPKSVSCTLFVNSQGAGLICRLPH